MIHLLCVLSILAAGAGHAASAPVKTLAAHTLAAQATESTLHPADGPVLHGDPAHPARADHWVDTRLYFELGPWHPNHHTTKKHHRKPVTEAVWMQFLDREVTPRFPDGLSVQNVYGQWKGVRDRLPHRGRSKLLIIDYPETVENEARIDAIRSAWKRLTGEQSVLKVTIPAEVSF